MIRRSFFLRVLPCIFWISALITIPIWASIQIPQWTSRNLCRWDFDVYSRAIRSLKAGHDPYLDGTALQESVQKNGEPGEDSVISFSYVYTPITLPLGLILFRHIAASAHHISQAAITIPLLAAAVYLDCVSWFDSRSVECPILVCVFALGCWKLIGRSRDIVAVPVLESVT